MGSHSLLSGIFLTHSSVYMSIQVSQCIPTHHLCLHMFAQLLSCVKLFVTLWTVAHQTPLPRGFSRQEYYSGLPFPSPGYFPDPGLKKHLLCLLHLLHWEAYSPHLTPVSITISSFSTFVTLFLFCTSFLDSTYKQYHMVFVFLYDLLHSVWQSLDLYMLVQLALFHFLWLSDIPLYM